LQPSNREEGKKGGREEGKERDVSETWAADGVMVAVWMDGRGQIKGGRGGR